MDEKALLNSTNFSIGTTDAVLRLMGDDKTLLIVDIDEDVVFFLDADETDGEGMKTCSF